jgi:putative membrane protein
MSEDEEDPGRARRLHPAMMLAGALRSGTSNLFALLPAILLGVREGLGFFFIVLGVVAVPVVGIAVLRWWRFTYRIGADELVIEQGILRRTHRSIPFDRIQDVLIEQKLIGRLFGVVTVKIETGGGVKDEGALDCVTNAEAARLRETLRAGSVAVSTADETIPEAAPAEGVIFRMGLGRVLLFGAFNFSLLWMAALMGLLQFADDLLPVDRETVIGWFYVAEHEASARFGLSLVLWIVALLLLLGFVSGLVGTTLREFGFRLMQGDGRFRRVRGLLTRSEVSVAIRRIQLSLVERRLVTGALGFASLKFQSLGGSNDQGGRQEMAPFATAAELDAVVAASGLPRFERPGLRPVAAGHVVRSLIERVAPFLILVVASALVLTPWAWWGLAAAPVIVGVSLLVRRFHRYALRDTSLQVMRGVLRRREWTVPYDSIQVVTVRQDLIQRMLGIASVEVDTAGATGRGRPHIEDASTGDAIVLARELIARA